MKKIFALLMLIMMLAGCMTSQPPKKVEHKDIFAELNKKPDFKKDSRMQILEQNDVPFEEKSNLSEVTILQDKKTFCKYVYTYTKASGSGGSSSV
ncbi:hypothetical protein [Bacillus sp. NPDC094106]|uniref:hypothetical protein n=1 Tax=Bacillus sp. NPDC094106 TaxID=3363949 RepID=UPI003824757A